MSVKTNEQENSVRSDLDELSAEEAEPNKSELEGTNSVVFLNRIQRYQIFVQTVQEKGNLKSAPDANLQNIATTLAN